MKTKLHLQQGDVILRRITSIPKGAKKITDPRGAVLAEGEATGHFHGCASGLEVLDLNGKRFARNTTQKPVALIHQEHKPVMIPPGIYEIGQVREKDWFQDMVRTVID